MSWEGVDPPRDEDGPRFTERDFERYERAAVREFTPNAVHAEFDVNWEHDYNFVTKEEFGRVKWREKGKRGRWHKLALFTSEAHPTLLDLYDHRAEYIAAWLNGAVA